MLGAKLIFKNSTYKIPTYSLIDLLKYINEQGGIFSHPPGLIWPARLVRSSECYQI